MVSGQILVRLSVKSQRLERCWKKNGYGGGAGGKGVRGVNTLQAHFVWLTGDAAGLNGCRPVVPGFSPTMTCVTKYILYLFTVKVNVTYEFLSLQ